MSRLRSESLGRILQIGGVELREIARDAVLQLLAPPLHLALRKVLVARVDSLELRAINGHARLRQQSHLAAQLDELRTYLLDGRAIVLAKVGDRLVIGREPLQKPDNLQIASRLTLQPATRLDAIEIAVNIELQQRRGVIAGPAGRRRLDVLEAQIGQVECVDEGIDRTNRVALIDPVVETFRQQRRLTSIRAFNVSLHQSPPQIARPDIPDSTFSRSQ